MRSSLVRRPSAMPASRVSRLVVVGQIIPWNFPVDGGMEKTRAGARHWLHRDASFKTGPRRHRPSSLWRNGRCGTGRCIQGVDKAWPLNPKAQPEVGKLIVRGRS